MNGWFDNRSFSFEFVKGCQDLHSAVDVLLDIGPGIRPTKLVDSKIHICAEPHKEYIDHYNDLRNSSLTTDKSSYQIWLQLDWQKCTEQFPPKAVDCVVLMDVVEHLDKSEGLELLAKTEYLSKGQIVVFTPLGFMPQCHPDGIDAWGLGGGSRQEHKSGWMPEDFSSRYLILLCRQFHFSDHSGLPFASPYGAFLAIRL